MSLADVTLLKTYRDKFVLFEKDLDNLKNGTEQAFATLFLNLTQLRLDAFASNYDYNNDGVKSLSSSLQEQINSLSSGGTPITGTSSDTFTINTDGNAVVLSSFGLTATQTYTFPNVSGEIVTTVGAQNITGVKTFTSPILTNPSSTNGTFVTPSISSPTLTGTVTLTGSTITSGTFNTPTINNAVFSGSSTGTYTLGGTLTIASPTLTGTVASSGVTFSGSPTINTPTFSGTTTVSSGNFRISSNQILSLDGSSQTVYARHNTTSGALELVSNQLTYQQFTTTVGPQTARLDGSDVDGIAYYVQNENPGGYAQIGVSNGSLNEGWHWRINSSGNFQLMYFDGSIYDSKWVVDSNGNLDITDGSRGDLTARNISCLDISGRSGVFSFSTTIGVDLSVFEISGDNSGTGAMSGLKFSTTGGTLDYIFEIANAYTDGAVAGAYFRKIPVSITGVGTKYIHLFN